MRVLVLSGVLLAANVNAQSLNGVVVDDQGHPVSAKISVIGSRESVTTDGDGRFAFEKVPDKTLELHVSAPGYGHLAVHVEALKERDLRLVLHPTVMEQIDVYGLPIHASNMESVQPISVIRGDELRRKGAGTLGETLKNEAGIHSTYYGPVSSSPIIRGMDGPRVHIAQNGLDAADVSRIGPDHAVATETGTAEQIEILRGPATLFYGAGAIGGVVNVVDDRVPRDNQTKAHFNAGHNSIADENFGGFGVTSGSAQIAYHLDAYWRNGNDYKIPKTAGTDHDDTRHADRLINSASESNSINVGSSYLFDSGLIGFSFGKLARNYGIPGHHHGVHEDHDDEEDHHEEVHAEDNLQAKLRQNRWQLQGEFGLDRGFLSDINVKLGYTDYQHREIHAEVEEFADSSQSTRFENTTLQGRVDFLHREMLGWRGAFSTEYKTADFASAGAEAFTPPSQTNVLALALIEEKHAGAALWQLGARIEKIRIETDSAVLPTFSEHENIHEAAIQSFHRSYNFTPYSLSGGFIWDFIDGYKFGVSYTHGQRAPSAGELFALGPHIGTRTFEIGSVYDIHHEFPDEFHLIFTGRPKAEKSNNIDISLRKHKGNFGFLFNIFYNEISDYYYQTATGLTTHELFNHQGEDHEEHSDLPVYVFRQSDAVFYGAELELVWRPAEYFQWTLWGDNVQAELKSGEYLPRTPPQRLGVVWDLKHKRWSSKLGLNHHFEQDDTAPDESSTDAYTLLNAEISYLLNLGGTELTWYLQGDNLTNEDARVHSSFLKDQAPLPGRGFRIGLRGAL